MNIGTNCVYMYVTAYAIDASHHIVGVTNPIGGASPMLGTPSLNLPFYSDPTNSILTGAWATDPSSCGCSWTWGDIVVSDPSYTSHTMLLSYQNDGKYHGWDLGTNIGSPACGGPTTGDSFVPVMRQCTISTTVELDYLGLSSSAGLTIP